MAMTKCNECAAEISTKADACPKCGAMRPKPTSRLTLAVAGFFGLIALMAIFNTGGPESKHPATVQAAVQKTKEQESFSQRSTSAATAMQFFKASLRDPDSLKWESVRTNDTGSVICLEYQARNGFGGMNRAFVVFVGTMADQSTKGWNKHCTKNMHDMAIAAQQLLDLSGG